MNNIGSVPLETTTIPEDVLQSVLSLHSEIADNQPVQQQPQGHQKHTQAHHFHSQQQVPHHHPQKQPHMQQQYHAQTLQQQQSHQQFAQQQNIQNQFFSQSFTQPVQSAHQQSRMQESHDFSMASPFSYQPPPPYHANPLHSPSNYNSASIPLTPTNSLPHMATQNHPVPNSPNARGNNTIQSFYPGNAFTPPHAVQQISPMSQIPSSSNANQSRRHLSRSSIDSSVDESYRNPEKLSSHELRQLTNAPNQLGQHPNQQQQYSTGFSQSPNAVPSSLNNQRPANNRFIESISPPNRPPLSRSNSVNSQHVPPSQQVSADVLRQYPGGNALSMQQPNNYPVDMSNSFAQVKSPVDSNRPGNNASTLQPRRLSNPMVEGSNLFPTNVEIDNPFIHPSSAQLNQNKSQNFDRLNSSLQQGSHILNMTSEHFANTQNSPQIVSTLWAPPSGVQENHRSDFNYLAELSSNTSQMASRNSNMYNPSQIPNSTPSRTAAVPEGMFPSDSYQVRYPQLRNAVAGASRPPGVNHQPVANSPPTRLPAPRGGYLKATPVRGAAPPPARGSASSRGPRYPNRGAPPSARGAPASTRGAPASTRGAPASTRGAPASTRGAPASARGAPASTRGAPATRGSPATRGAPPSSRGAPPSRGALSMRAAPAARVQHYSEGPPSGRGAPSNRARGTASNSSRGVRNQGRGRAHTANVMNAEFSRLAGPCELPVGNPIQCYRLPDANASTGFQSDIEAMRASMSSETPKSNVSGVQIQNQCQNRVVVSTHHQTSNDTSSLSLPRRENETVANKQTSQNAGASTQSRKESMARVKQEMVEGSTKGIAESSSPVNKNNNSNLINNNNVSQNTQNHQIKTNVSSTFSNKTPTVNTTRPENIPATHHQTKTADCVNNVNASTYSQSWSDDTLVDRKPLIGLAKARSLWRDGKVVGRAPMIGKSKFKALSTSTSSNNQQQGEESNPVAKNVTENEKGQADTANRNVNRNDMSGTNDCNQNVSKNQNVKKNLFYVLFHGHKLLCLSTSHGNAVLVCQFQYECFTDKGKGMVSNCINKALRIKKKVLEHPDKEIIISFLRNNGYLKGILQHEPVHVMSLDDARRVYHFIYKIKNCSIATCVVEVSNQSVDLSIVISPSKRKILTQEMKMRIKREKKHADDERYGRIQVPETSSQRTDVIGPKKTNALSGNDFSRQRCSGSGSDRSDCTLVYGGDDEDESDDVVIVEGLEDPYLLKWDGKQSKPGCVCNTIVGQVRSYHHEGNNYLVVSDLCRILGTTEFMTGIETDNVILYSCTKDILSFLNELSKNFPQLDTGQNCLVKEKDVGVHATDDDQNPAPEIQSIVPVPLKRPFCKQELVEDDGEEGCSNPKQQRVSKDTINKDTSIVVVSVAGNEKQNECDQDGESMKKVESADPFSKVTNGVTISEVSKNLQDADDSNVIMIFDSNSIDNTGKSSETALNIGKSKAKEYSKDQKATTGLSSPDSCISLLSQDGPLSPTVLRQNKDVMAPSQPNQNNPSTSRSTCQFSKSKMPVVIGDNDINHKNSDNLFERICPANLISEEKSTIKSPTAIKDLSSKSKTVSTAAGEKNKMIVATVIDINSLTAANNNASNKKVGDNGLASATASKTQPLPSKPTTSKGLPALKSKYFEDDSVLSRQHMTSMEGLEEYQSRGSLLKEMELLRFKNKTLQETLKALRDQLKKSKAEQEKSGKLATYYKSVIQEITASFKDGDKVEPALPNTQDSPILIDDEEDNS